MTNIIITFTNTNIIPAFRHHNNFGLNLILLGSSNMTHFTSVLLDLKTE